LKIDCDIKDTEAGWQSRLDKFWLVTTPIWFEWISWLLIIGGLTFVSQKTLNISVKILTVLSYILLFMYFQSFFYQFEFINLPYIKRYPSFARSVSLAISGLLGFGVYFLISISVSTLH